MEILYFFERIRTPLLDSFFLGVTQLGDEIFFIAIALLFFWCVDKNTGYYLMSVCFFGIVINQTLKLSMKVERPWVAHPQFSIVEAAREAASGYSFPSGHTQNAVSIFACLGVSAKKFFPSRKRRICVCILCTVCAVLVLISRMYLGVHTPYDVTVSCVIALVIVLAFFPVFKTSQASTRTLYIIIAIMLVCSVAYLIYSGSMDMSLDENIASGHRHAWYMLGAVTAIAVGFPIERKYINFDTHATFFGQTIKLLVGTLMVVIFKSVSKAPLNLLFSGHGAAEAVRYFVIVFFAICIWPLTFRFFSKAKKQED